MTRSHEASKTVKLSANPQRRIMIEERLTRSLLATILQLRAANKKYHADKKRRKLEFDEGDLVMLRSEALNLFNSASSPKKWRKKWIGPLLIL